MTREERTAKFCEEVDTTLLILASVARGYSGVAEELLVAGKSEEAPRTAKEGVILAMAAKILALNKGGLAKSIDHEKAEAREAELKREAN